MSAENRNKTLTTRDVATIRAMASCTNRSQKSIAAKLGVSRSTVSNVVNGISYPDPEYRPPENNHEKINIKFCCEMRERGYSFVEIARLEKEKMNRLLPLSPSYIRKSISLYRKSNANKDE